MTLITSVIAIAILRGRVYARVRVATHPYALPRGRLHDVRDPTIRFQSKVKTRLTFTALRRRLLAGLQENLAGRPLSFDGAPILVRHRILHITRHR